MVKYVKKVCVIGDIIVILTVIGLVIILAMGIDPSNKVYIARGLILLIFYIILRISYLDSSRKEQKKIEKEYNDEPPSYDQLSLHIEDESQNQTLPNKQDGSTTIQPKIYSHHYPDSIKNGSIPLLPGPTFLENGPALPQHVTASQLHGKIADDGLPSFDAAIAMAGEL